MIFHEYPNIFWSAHAGCEKVSPGCDNCVELVQSQLCSENNSFLWKNILKDGQWNGRVSFSKGQLSKLFRIKKIGLTVWVNQLGDIFHENVHDTEIDKILSVIARLGQHRFVITTRRPERMIDYMNHPNRPTIVQSMSVMWEKVRGIGPIIDQWPLPNLTVGVSVSIQSEANSLIPKMLETNSAKKMVCVAPILSEMDLSQWPSIDWLVVRGEYGSNRRAPDPGWVVNLRDWAIEKNIPFYFKGWGVDIEKHSDEKLLDAARGKISIERLPAPGTLEKMIDGNKYNQVPFDKSTVLEKMKKTIFLTKGDQ